MSDEYPEVTTGSIAARENRERMQRERQSSLAAMPGSDVRPVIRQSIGDCGVEVPHVFDTTVMPPHPDKLCRCGKQTWKKAETETLAQLRCPKCAAMHYNVHASDLAKGNGEVTCSNCGHVRVIKTFSTAKPRTSPLATVGRENAKAISASPPGNQSETNGAPRHPNRRTDQPFCFP